MKADSDRVDPCADRWHYAFHQLQQQSNEGTGLAPHLVREILDQLRRDAAQVHSGYEVPSNLTLLLPDDADDPIMAALAGMCGNGNHVVGHLILNGMIRTVLGSFTEPEALSDVEPPNPIGIDDLAQALRVLRIIQAEQTRPSMRYNPLQSEIDQILAFAKTIPERAPYRSLANPDVNPEPALPRLTSRTRDHPRCYICKSVMKSHRRSINPWLCIHCAEFNAHQSQPVNPARFHGKVALVTGGRINLGFATVLRLLRGGASLVFATTRFHVDAQNRYASCADHEDWRDRLVILEADFTDAGDVTCMIEKIKGLLHGRTLDILINNAAQTVPIPRVERERLMMLGPAKGRSELQFIEEDRAVKPYTSLETSSVIREETSIVSVRGQPVKNSWTAHYDEIPYVEMFNVLTVNSVVPFVLIRELANLMARSDREVRRSDPAFIVNVSSREGIFLRKDNIGRAPHHVHTNMAKAAMNMITETLADEFRDHKGIYMNSVDPGYLSIQHAVPDDERVQRTAAVPLTWEDGAARVLYPVECGIEGKLMSGRFLKDYQERPWHPEYDMAPDLGGMP